MKKNGEKVMCRIVDVDSAEISFQQDSLASVIQKQDVMALKIGNEKMIFFFTPDTLFGKNGEQIICKVTGLIPISITYLPVDSSIGNPVTVSSKKFSKIHFGNGSLQFFEKKSDYEYVDSQFSTDMSSYQKGESDAQLYFNTKPIFASEVFCGLATYAFGAGLIMGTIAYVVPPQELNSPNNPNNDLLKTDHNYYEGYMHSAKKMKHKRALRGYATGVIVPIAAAILIINVLSD